jgi:hypothetical protein
MEKKGARCSARDAHAVSGLIDVEVAAKQLGKLIEAGVKLRFCRAGD